MQAGMTVNPLLKAITLRATLKRRCVNDQSRRIKEPLIPGMTIAPAAITPDKKIINPDENVRLISGI